MSSKQLQTSLDNANLLILNSRAQLKSYRFDGLEDLPAGEDALSDPAVVASDVAAQSVCAQFHSGGRLADDAPASRSSANLNFSIWNRKPKTNMSR
jgi:hypothetical protein